MRYLDVDPECLKQGEIIPGGKQRNHLLLDKEVEHTELPSRSLPQADGGTVIRQPPGAAPQPKEVLS